MVDDGFLPNEIEIDDDDDEEEKLLEVMKAFNRWKILFRTVLGR